MLKKKSSQESAIEALSKAQELSFAPLTFQALATMIDLGILELLDKQPSFLNEIMKKLSLDEYTVKTLLQVGEVSKLVKSENGKYSLTKKGAVFLYDEMTIANFNFIKDVCYLGASELTASFKEKKPKGLQKFFGEKYDTIYPYFSILPDKTKNSWYSFDHLYSDNCFDKLFKIITKKYNKIYDIGGNTGKFEKVCLKNDPNLDITMLDLPENISVAVENPELKGCKFYPINILSDIKNYPQIENSAVLMSQFLDCFSKEQVIYILNNLRLSMDKNSSIYILEPFTDNQKYDAAKLSLTHISLYFTCMANGISKMYTQMEMIEMIETAGLKVFNIHNNLGAFDYTLLECNRK
ncbi:SAM-dependent methyltransferase [bacterium]|nr:SAM-dependent methyltransferase [bacterium]